MATTDLVHLHHYRWKRSWDANVTRGIFLFVLLASGCRAQRDRGAELPDRRLTPGATVSITHEQVCEVGFSRTQRIRFTVAEKREICRRYDLTYMPAFRSAGHSYSGCVIDHLIPLEIGGANNILNEWPEPTGGEWSASKKDALENRVRWLICDGKISLERAQREIAENWIEMYGRVFR